MPVLKYHREYEQAVRDGTKRQTIRRRGKVAAVGEPLHHQDHAGRPMRTDPCTGLRALAVIGTHEWILDGQHIGIDQRNAIAQADGFENYCACAKALRRIYGLPLDAQIISW